MQVGPKYCSLALAPWVNKHTIKGGIGNSTSNQYMDPRNYNTNPNFHWKGTLMVLLWQVRTPPLIY